MSIETAATLTATKLKHRANKKEKVMTMTKAMTKSTKGLSRPNAATAVYAFSAWRFAVQLGQTFLRHIVALVLMCGCHLD